MDNIITLANIHSNLPVKNKQDEFSITDKLELYYKTGYIHIYKSIREYIIKILEEVLPKYICYQIINYFSIDKVDYIPTMGSFSSIKLPYYSSYDMTMWYSNNSIRYNIYKLDGYNTLETELCITMCCEKAMIKIIKLMVHFREKYQSDDLVVDKMFGKLVYKISSLEQNKVSINRDCGCIEGSPNKKNGLYRSQPLDKDKQRKEYLTWNSYPHVTDPKGVQKNYMRIYYDITQLYHYINYHIDY